MWGNRDWVGGLYRRPSRASELLPQYASVFNAVEGNTTFYSTPSPESIERWLQQTPPEFRFCCKLPQEITHRLGLVGVEAATAEFLRRMTPLKPRLGPFMVQLPPTFGPARLGRLDSFLRSLPGEFRYAVELRHPAFSAGEAERRVNELLTARDCARVIVDSRTLRSDTTPTAAVIAAMRDKPNLPVHPVVTAGDPIVRFVGHSDEAVVQGWLQRWGRRLQAWIEADLSPYFFVHVPDNAYAPVVARRLHAVVRRRLPGVGTMPPWPGERGGDPQLRLL